VSTVYIKDEKTEKEARNGSLKKLYLHRNGPKDDPVKISE